MIVCFDHGNLQFTAIEPESAAEIFDPDEFVGVIADKHHKGLFSGPLRGIEAQVKRWSLVVQG